MGKQEREAKKAIDRVRELRAELKEAKNEAARFGCCTCKHRVGPSFGEPCLSCEFGSKWSMGE